jgi:hypothetical protein
VDREVTAGKGWYQILAERDEILRRANDAAAARWQAEIAELDRMCARAAA